MESSSGLEVLIEIFKGVVIFYVIVRILSLWLYSFLACTAFKLSQTKSGFLFIGILGGALSFLITVVLGFVGIDTWGLYITVILDLICVFTIVYFIRKIV